MCCYITSGRCTFIVPAGCQDKADLYTTYTTYDKCTYAAEGKCYFESSLPTDVLIQPQQLIVLNLQQMVLHQIGVQILIEFVQQIKLILTVQVLKKLVIFTQQQIAKYQELVDMFKAKPQTLETNVALTASMTCAQIFPGEGLATHNKCNGMKSGCTKDGANACGKRTCANVTNVLHDSYTADICEQWKSGCVPNNTNTGCVFKVPTCAEQTAAGFPLSTEGYCQVVNNKFILKTCSQADPATNTTHDNCQTFLSTCTIVPPGGCQARDVILILHLDNVNIMPQVLNAIGISMQNLC